MASSRAERCEPPAHPVSAETGTSWALPTRCTIVVAGSIPDRPRIGAGKLLQSQWSGWPRYHRSHAHLLVHAEAVASFLGGNAVLVVALPRGSIGGVAAGSTIKVTSLAMPGCGHAIEQTPTEPFTGVANPVARIHLEQWITFPRFVLSGPSPRALRASAR